MRRIFWRIVLLSFSFLACLTCVMGWRFYHKLEHEVISRFSNHQWEVPSKLYAEPILLYPGLDINRIGLLDLLVRLDYRSSSNTVQVSGEYFYDPQKSALQLFLHDAPANARTRRHRRINIDLTGDHIEQLTDLDDESGLRAIELEPELITGLYDQEWEERRVVRLYEVPSLLIKALLAAEDQRFFEHEGVDPLRILGAGWANFLAGKTTQGGSTLTQQLVKNFFLTQERTVRRKMVEACISLILELHYSKLEILENYLNEIYLGQRGAKSILGMWEAARFYFGKEPRDLTLSEMAVLTGMVKAPNLYAPTRHPDAALQRRNYVLQRMYEHGDISSDEYNAALQDAITTRKLSPDINGAPYFADFAREQLQRTYPNDALTTAGLHVFTSLDMQLQRIGQDVVRRGVEELESQHPRLRRSKQEDRLQACLIAMQPQTGAILAMVGGRDYQSSQFNRVSQAHRQSGSIFKPIVYLTALSRERERRAGRFLPTSTILDSPFTWSWGDQAWSPGNYKDKYYGTVTLRRALEQSLNAATARIAKSVGLKSIKDTAQRLGFVSPLPLYPSLVLGSAEVTPLEVAVAFSTLANQGVRVKPLPIKRVANQDGETLERRTLEVEQVIPPEDAYMITHMMEGVIERGTGKEIRKRGFALPAAGKTGTTNDYGDAWFVGYTPDLVVVVWVGFDHRASLDLSGGQAALPIWTEFMKKATDGRPATCFVPPPGVRVRQSSYETEGANSCPAVAAEAFYLHDEPEHTDFPAGPRTVPVGVTTPTSPFPTGAERPSETTSQLPPAPSLPASSERKPWWRLF